MFVIDEREALCIKIAGGKENYELLGENHSKILVLGF